MAERVNLKGIIKKQKEEAIKKQEEEAKSLKNLSAIALKIKSQAAKKARIPRYHKDLSPVRAKGGTGGTPPGYAGTTSPRGGMRVADPPVRDDAGEARGWDWGGATVGSGAPIKTEQYHMSMLPPPDPSFDISDDIRLEILDPIKQMDKFRWMIWEQIKTKYTRNKLSCEYRMRIPNSDSHNMTYVKDWIQLTYDHFGNPAKLTVKVSYLVKHRITGEYRFFCQVSDVGDGGCLLNLLF